MYQVKEVVSTSARATSATAHLSWSQLMLLLKKGAWLLRLTGDEASSTTRDSAEVTRIEL